LALLIFLSALAFTPGPNTTLSATLAANAGLRRAMPFVCAVPVGWCLMFLLCVLGVGAMLTAAPGLRWALQAAGVAYLLWLAWRLAQASAWGAASTQSLRVGFAQGVALQFVNIKAWLTALTVSTGWITTAPDPWARLGWVLPVLAAFAFGSNLAYALVGAALRQWLTHGRRLLMFNRVMAATLAATAVWMLWR
jgi:threonine/homoserine/homoserine lactone efflux protein